MNDIRDASLVGRNTAAKLVRRPVSPHLGIYRWPITMVASILNRATGIALSVGALLLVWWLAAAASGPVAFASVQAFIASPLGLLLLLGWTAALFYHFFGGIRHLVWDAGHGLAKRDLNWVTWAILGLTALATFGVWVVGYLQMGALAMGGAQKTSTASAQITVMRSQLGRVRGTGAAHAGSHHWRAERLTAIALVPLTVWFVIAVLAHLGADQPAIAAWAGRPWNATLLLAMVAMTFHHMHLGLQVVYEDYIHSIPRREAAIMATKGACLLLGLLAAVSVLKLAVAAH